jgi:hypothetical protein
MICKEAAYRKCRQQDTSRHKDALEATLAALANKLLFGGGISSNSGHLRLTAAASAGTAADVAADAEMADTSGSSNTHVSKKLKRSSLWPAAVREALWDDYIFHNAKQTYDAALLEGTVFDLFDFHMRPPQRTSYR